jgi:ankyrin repeat protein
MLLEHGARASGIAFGGGTLLTYAIQADDFDTAYELIEHGANVNAVGASGATPLAFAASSGTANYPVRQRIIKLLTESGAHR